MKALILLVTIAIGSSTAWGALGARARVTGKNGAKVTGTVEFKELENGQLKITYNLKNLPKNQTMGMHIHEVGDCTAKDGKSAGGHYAYMHSEGGTSTDSPSHYAGDLPSISSNSNGKASGTFTVANLSINRENAVVKRSIVIHNGPDNVNEPAAPRIACGLIEGPPIAPQRSNASDSSAAPLE